MACNEELFLSNGAQSEPLKCQQLLFPLFLSSWTIYIPLILILYSEHKIKELSNFRWSFICYVCRNSIIKILQMKQHWEYFFCSIFLSDDNKYMYIKSKVGKIKLSLYLPWRPLGLREVEAPTFSDIRLIDGGKVVSPMLRPLFTPRKIPGSHFS
jgi:hypothetical protein